MKTLLAATAILSLLAAGTAVAGSKMSGGYAGDGPRMQMSDSDSYPDRAKDRREYEKYDDDDDRSEYMRNRYDDDDDHAYSDRSERAFQRMDINGDGMIDKQEFKSHMQMRKRS